MQAARLPPVQGAGLRGVRLPERLIVKPQTLDRGNSVKQTVATASKNEVRLWYKIKDFDF